ncbi:chromate transporter [Orenia marismortui]|uniref:chromate transporter n=1 Tax=Orenia marismortui TaxID=46469 RepID=UPI000363BFC2|nr:chromate transporter [Orenia marismortui]
MNKIRLKELFSIFLRIGGFTFGGGYAMLPLIEKEFVEDKKLLSEDEFIDIIAIVQGIPGIIAINSSLFIGYKLRGIFGALISALAMSLPSIVIIISIAQLLLNLKDNSVLNSLFTGIRSAVVVLIFWAGYRMGKKAINNYTSILYTFGMLVGVLYFKISPIILIIIAGVIGAISSINETRESGNGTN